MKVYFYHTQNLNQIYSKWQEGKFPGHFLYGATHLPKHGVDVVMHKHKDISSRIRLAIYVTWRVMTCREHFDAIYATRFNGLELLIFLRALHLYRKPIIIWHHQPIVKADNGLREMAAQVFYKGIDHMFFFSERLIQDSLRSSKANEERMQVGHWGGDLEYYDRLKEENPVEEHVGFISTGKEKRDMPTLIRAFSATGHPLDIYIAYSACGDNYLEILNDLRPSANIHINFMKGLIPNELAQKVWGAKCVAICCQETNYTVGLTTLVEALALGLPVISTRNVTFPFDIEKEGVGIIVPYYDSVAWERAIRYISSNPEEADQMGRKARQLAERMYNLDKCASEVAEAIKKYDKHAGKTEKAVTPKTESVITEQPKTIVQSEPTYSPEPLTTSETESVTTQAKTWKTEDDEWETPFTERHRTTSSRADEPIINTEALKKRMQTLIDKTQGITDNIKSAASHLPSKEQLQTYLPPKEDIIEIWDKVKKLAVKYIERLRSK